MKALLTILNKYESKEWHAALVELQEIKTEIERLNQLPKLSQEHPCLYEMAELRRQASLLKAHFRKNTKAVTPYDMRKLVYDLYPVEASLYGGEAQRKKIDILSQLLTCIPGHESFDNWVMCEIYSSLPEDVTQVLLYQLKLSFLNYQEAIDNKSDISTLVAGYLEHIDLILKRAIEDTIEELEIHYQGIRDHLKNPRHKLFSKNPSKKLLPAADATFVIYNNLLSTDMSMGQGMGVSCEPGLTCSLD